MISRNPEFEEESLDLAVRPPHLTRRVLPVTLLSGFLGSGKTTLLEHILKSSDHGLRIAVIVNDMSSLNIDASLLQHHTVSSSKEKLIQMQNGCICCTLRGDLLSEIVNLARDDKVQYVVIESTGISEPMQVAETFTTEFTNAMIEAGGLEEEELKIIAEINELGGMQKLARLDTCVTVIDSFNMFHNLSTAEFLSDRWASDNITPEDERTISDLLIDQIEFANVIIINKLDQIDGEMKRRVMRLCKQLNPTAKLIESKYSKVDVKEIVETGMFTFEEAATGAGWLRSLHELTQREVGGKNKMVPKPETEEYGISSFVYSARRPFHPKRLWELIHDKFIVLQNVEQDEDDGEDEDAGDDDADADTDMRDADESDEDKEEKEWESEDEEPKSKEEEKAATEKILQAKRDHPAFAPLLRSKGFMWLATRPAQHGEWSQAGSILTIQGGSPWFCDERASWPEDPDIRAAIQADFKGPWGDRRQELVFIGESIDKEAVSKLLDGALLTDKEWKIWEKIMKNGVWTEEKKQSRLVNAFEDFWEDWATTPMEPDEEGHEGHHH